MADAETSSTHNRLLNEEADDVHLSVDTTVNSAVADKMGATAGDVEVTSPKPPLSTRSHLSSRTVATEINFVDVFADQEAKRREEKRERWKKAQRQRGCLMRILCSFRCDLKRKRLKEVIYIMFGMALFGLFVAVLVLLGHFYWLFPAIFAVVGCCIGTGWGVRRSRRNEDQEIMIEERGQRGKGMGEAAMSPVQRAFRMKEMRAKREAEAKRIAALAAKGKKRFVRPEVTLHDSTSDEEDMDFEAKTLGFEPDVVDRYAPGAVNLHTDDGEIDKKVLKAYKEQQRKKLRRQRIAEKRRIMKQKNTKRKIAPDMLRAIRRDVAMKEAKLRNKREREQNYRKFIAKSKAFRHRHARWVKDPVTKEQVWVEEAATDDEDRKNAEESMKQMQEHTQTKFKKQKKGKSRTKLQESGDDGAEQGSGSSTSDSDGPLSDSTEDDAAGEPSSSSSDNIGPSSAAPKAIKKPRRKPGARKGGTVEQPEGNEASDKPKFHHHAHLAKYDEDMPSRFRYAVKPGGGRSPSFMDEDNAEAVLCTEPGCGWVNGIFYMCRVGVNCRIRTLWWYRYMMYDIIPLALAFTLVAATIGVLVGSIFAIARRADVQLVLRCGLLGGLFGALALCAPTQLGLSYARRIRTNMQFVGWVIFRRFMGIAPLSCAGGGYAALLFTGAGFCVGWLVEEGIGNTTAAVFSVLGIMLFLCAIPWFVYRFGGWRYEGDDEAIGLPVVEDAVANYDESDEDKEPATFSPEELKQVLTFVINSEKAKKAKLDVAESKAKSAGATADKILGRDEDPEDIEAQVNAEQQGKLRPDGVPLGFSGTKEQFEALKGKFVAFIARQKNPTTGRMPDMISVVRTRKSITQHAKKLMDERDQIEIERRRRKKENELRLHLIRLGEKTANCFRFGNMPTAISYMAEGVDPNQIVDGLPLLTHAVLGTQGAIGVRLLLKHNADPDDFLKRRVHLIELERKEQEKHEQAELEFRQKRLRKKYWLINMEDPPENWDYRTMDRVEWKKKQMVKKMALAKKERGRKAAEIAGVIRGREDKEALKQLKLAQAERAVETGSIESGHTSEFSDGILSEDVDVGDLSESSNAVDSVELSDVTDPFASDSETASHTERPSEADSVSIIELDSASPPHLSNRSQAPAVPHTALASSQQTRVRSQAVTSTVDGGSTARTARSTLPPEQRAHIRRLWTSKASQAALLLKPAAALAAGSDSGSDTLSQADGAGESISKTGGDTDADSKASEDDVAPEPKPEPEKRDEGIDMAPLHMAVRVGDLMSVRALLVKTADINVRTLQERRTILHIAVSHGRSEILAYLIDNFQDKLDFDAVDADGVSIANELEGVLVYGPESTLGPAFVEEEQSRVKHMEEVLGKILQGIAERRLWRERCHKLRRKRRIRRRQRRFQHALDKRKELRRLAEEAANRSEDSDPSSGSSGSDGDSGSGSESDSSGDSSDQR